MYSTAPKLCASCTYRAASYSRLDQDPSKAPNPRRRCPSGIPRRPRTSRSPPIDQQRLAASTGQNQRSKNTSLPYLPSHTKPSQTKVASSGTSSSLRRGQQPRQRKSNQGRVLDTPHSPTQVQEPQELHLPPLPLPPQTTGSTQSSSRSAATHDRSGSPHSCSSATTVFSDTEEGTAITTEDLDFNVALLLGRTLGSQQSRFNWSPSGGALTLAKKCAYELKKSNGTKLVDGIIVVTAFRGS